MSYPKTTIYLRPIPRGMTLPQRFMVEGVGQCAVKFLQNPQGPRALVNELVGFGVANLLGLEHPECGVVEVQEASLPEGGVLEVVFEDENPITGQRTQRPLRFLPGPHFYSRWLEPVDEVFSTDLDTWGNVVNSSMMAGVVLLDLLLGNWDRKPKNTNLILHRESRRQHLKLIDLGMAFGSAVWVLGDLSNPNLPPLSEPLPYSYPPAGLLNSVNPDTDFPPYLARMKNLSDVALEKIVQGVPNEWNLSTVERKALIHYLKVKVQAVPGYLAQRMASRTKKWWE